MTQSRLFVSPAATVILAFAVSACGGRDADPALPSSEAPAGEEAPSRITPAEPAGPLTDADRAAMDDPCTLLSAAEVREVTGRPDYEEGSPGDALGEGAGGGASCQWSGPVFGGPPDPAPVISVIVVPPRDGRRWTEGIRANPRPDCTYEEAAGAGQGAFFETCTNAREVPVYVPSRAVDLIVAMEVIAPATAASVHETLERIAGTVAGKLN